MNRLFAEGSSLRTNGAWLLRRSRWLFLLILTILGGTSTLLAIPETSNRIRSQIPFTRCWFPVPMDSAKFALIVSPFVTLSASGRASVQRDGRELAHFLYTQLESNLDKLGLDVPVELRAPERTCPVRGSAAEERAQAASRMAAATGASVVVYGALADEGDIARFNPEFYVSAPTEQEQAELAAVAGPYQLGSPIPMKLPIRAQDFVGLDDHPALVRVRALSLIALGLRAGAGGQPERALEYLQTAEEIPGWLESEGKEIVYLFLGNTASTLAYQEKNTGFLDDANSYFDQALAIKPDFARAMVGKAGVLYQQSLGDFAGLKCSQVDTDGLQAAQDEYVAAAATSAPAEAEIPLKVHYGLGNIALIRSYCVDPQAIDQARTEYRAMVDLHEQAPVVNEELVGHAYARLALIAADHDKDPAQAVDFYKKALPLVPARWRAEYLILEGDLQRSQGDDTNAHTSYARAQEAATLAGASELVQEATQRLAAQP